MIKKFSAALLLVFGLWSLVPLSALAVGLPYWGPLVSCTGTNCTTCDLFSTAQMIVYFITTLTFFVVGPIMVTVGGLMMVVAGGNEERFSSGRRIATGAVIGIAITLGAFLIVNTLLRAVAPNFPGFSGGSGFTINCSAKSPFVPPATNQPPAGAGTSNYFDFPAGQPGQQPNTGGNQSPTPSAPNYFDFPTGQ